MRKNPKMTVFFHTFKDGRISYQGQVIRSLPGGNIEVQLFSWLGGCPTDTKVYAESETHDWRFYFSLASWLAAAEVALTI